MIWLADEKTRYERWDTLLEQIEDATEEERTAKKFVAARPWDTVIRESSYGAQNSSMHWWKLNVEAPAMKGMDAKRTMVKLEGSFHMQDDPATPYVNQRSSGSRGKNHAVKTKIGKGGDRKNSDKGGGKRAPHGVCYAWNNGGCSDGRDCPNSFTHVCQTCKGSHRRSYCTVSKGTKKGGGRKGGGKGKSKA